MKYERAYIVLMGFQKENRDRNSKFRTSQSIRRHLKCTNSQIWMSNQNEKQKCLAALAPCLTSHRKVQSTAGCFRVHARSASQLERKTVFSLSTSGGESQYQISLSKYSALWNAFPTSSSDELHFGLCLMIIQFLWSNSRIVLFTLMLKFLLLPATGTLLSQHM